MRLRIWLPPLREFRPETPVVFEVLDAQRCLLRRGEASLAGLPKDVDCELVLDALDVVMLDVQVPKMSRARLAGALPALVEERVVGEVERYHVAASRPDAHGHAVAAVVDRMLMRRALEIFHRAARRVVAATPQPLALGLSPGCWRASLSDGRGCVRTDVLAGLGFGWTAGPPVELRLLVTQATQPPAALEVEGVCDLQQWSAGLGIVVKAAPTERWAPPLVLDLLQYEFSSSMLSWRAWRPTLALGFALLLVALGGLNLHAWSLRAQERALRDAMVEIVKDTFPQTPVVLDPQVQMRRYVSDLRVGAGVERGQFLTLASRLGQVAEADSVESIEYRDGQLSARFRPLVADTGERRSALIERGSRAGIAVTFSGDSARLVQRTGP